MKTRYNLNTVASGRGNTSYDDMHICCSICDRFTQNKLRKLNVYILNPAIMDTSRRLGQNRGVTP